MMSFCRFFGLGPEVHPSRLAESDFMKFMTGQNRAERSNPSSSGQSEAISHDLPSSK
jgi:hypothetical protein